MTFNDKDYDGLRYPVHKKAPSQIKALMALEGMSALDDREICYLVYMCDKASPLHKISDTVARREFAADKAGFNVDKDDLEYLFELKTPTIRKAMVSLLRDGKSLEFTALIAFEQRFYENISHLMAPLDQDDINQTLKGAELKGKLESSTKNLIESILELREKIFGTEEVASKLTEVFTPEVISKKLRNV